MVLNGSLHVVNTTTFFFKNPFSSSIFVVVGHWRLVNLYVLTYLGYMCCGWLDSGFNGICIL